MQCLVPRLTKCADVVQVGRQFGKASVLLWAALSSFEPRAAPCASGAWERAGLFLLTQEAQHKLSKHSVWWEHLCILAVTQPAAHCLLSGELWALSVDAHRSCSALGWGELHAQSWNEPELLSEPGELRDLCSVVCVVLLSPFCQQRLLDCPAPPSRNILSPLCLSGWELWFWAVTHKYQGCGHLHSHCRWQR